MQKNHAITLLFLCSLLLTLGAGAFAQNTDHSLIPFRQGAKWGYADVNRNIVIAPKFAAADWFSHGLAAVKSGNKWGYINEAGKMVIPAKFTVAKAFRTGYMANASKAGGDSLIFAGASLRSDLYEVCINAKGAVLSKCPAIPENSVAENRIPVKSYDIKKTYSIANNDGLFDEITDDYKMPSSNETYYIAKKSGKFGVFNSKFMVVVPFEYDRIVLQNTHSSNPYLEVKKNDLIGLLNLQGNTVINAENTSMQVITTEPGKDYVVLQRGNKFYVKDLLNKDVMAEGYSRIQFDDHGFVITDGNSNKGYYMVATGKMIAPRYQDIAWVDGGQFLKVTNADGQAGFINTAGEEFFKDE